MKTVIFTSDSHVWLLKGFFHQWSKYANIFRPEIEVAGFTKPSILPKYATFYSIGKFVDYPVQRWSDGVIRYLQSMPDDLVLVLLEDYWLMRPVNRRALATAQNYMMAHPDVIRFDVAADRMFNRGARYIESCGPIDICECKGDYSLSFQASIFRRKLLLEMLEPGESPWQTEINGSGRLNESPYRVVGSYQWPMMYMIVVNKGQFDMAGEWMYPARSLSQEDWLDLGKDNCLKQPEKEGQHEQVL